MKKEIWVAVLAFSVLAIALTSVMTMASYLIGPDAGTLVAAYDAAVKDSDNQQETARPEKTVVATEAVSTQDSDAPEPTETETPESMKLADASQITSEETPSEPASASPEPEVADVVETVEKAADAPVSAVTETVEKAADASASSVTETVEKAADASASSVTETVEKAADAAASAITEKVENSADSPAVVKTVEKAADASASAVAETVEKAADAAASAVTETLDKSEALEAAVPETPKLDEKVSVPAEAPPAPAAEEPEQQKPLKTDENLIASMKPGDRIELEDGRIAYKVKSGDTFSQICQKVFGTSKVWQKVGKRMNIDYRKISPGNVMIFDKEIAN